MTSPDTFVGPGAADRFPAESRRRVALYSHDAQGLGHVRRNIELASAMTAAHPATDVLLLSSAAAAAQLVLPPSTQLVLLPAVHKDRQGGYSAARLGVELDEVLAMRSSMVAAALQSFTPDLLVVDKLARGLGGELDKALGALAEVGGNGKVPTRVVLGLRDVLDSPEVARAEWDAAQTSETLLSHYDQVWVYGDPEVYDPVREYGLPSTVADLVRYTGYLADGRSGLQPGSRPGAESTSLGHARPYVLCLVGGGQDGVELARTFADADVPAGHDAVLVTGPYMDPAERSGLHAAALLRPELTVHTVLDDPAPLIRDAAAVISMGGYNTVCEVLASRRPGLVVPRVRPRREQAVRLERLGRFTHLDHVLPLRATPGRLGDWLRDAVRRPARSHPIDLGGLATVPGLVDDLLVEGAAAREVCRVSA